MTMYQKGVHRTINRRLYCMTWKLRQMEFRDGTWKPITVELTLRDQTTGHWKQLHQGAYPGEQAAEIFTRFLNRNIDDLLMEHLL